MQKQQSKQIVRAEFAPELVVSYKDTTINCKLDTTEEQVKYLREIFDQNTFELREEMVIVALDEDYYPLGHYSLAMGSENEVAASYHLIFGILMTINAPAFFTAHNHPNKKSLPSYPDIKSTHEMMIRAHMLGISFEDSFILSSLEEQDGEIRAITVSETMISSSTAASSKEFDYILAAPGGECSAWLFFLCFAGGDIYTVVSYFSPIVQPFFTYLPVVNSKNGASWGKIIQINYCLPSHSK